MALRTSLDGIRTESRARFSRSYRRAEKKTVPPLLSRLVRVFVFIFVALECEFDALGLGTRHRRLEQSVPMCERSLDDL